MKKPQPYDVTDCLKDFLDRGGVRKHTLFKNGWKEDDPADANPKNKKIVVLYHENCWDGITAAWCAWQKFKSKAVYIPVNYNRPLPNVDWTYVQEVYVVDFSYKREILDELYAVVGGNLIVLDHHKTAKEELKERSYACFASKMSGAGMAWLYFKEGYTLHAIAKSKHYAYGSTSTVQYPQFVYHAQDYDLWEFKHKDTLAFRAALDLYPREIATIEKIHSARVNGTNPMNVGQLIKKGHVLLEQKRKLIDEAASTAFRMTFPMPGVPPQDSLMAEGYGVITANPSITSELGSVLAKRAAKEGLGGYSVVFAFNGKAIQGGQVFLSLRAVKGVDMTPCAKAYGGGGHAEACGCKWDYSFFLQFMGYLGIQSRINPDETAKGK